MARGRFRPVPRFHRDCPSAKTHCMLGAFSQACSLFGKLNRVIQIHFYIAEPDGGYARMFWHGESVAKRSEFYCAGQQLRHICGRRGYVVDHDTCVGYASLRRTPRHQNGGRFDLWNGCQPSSEISCDKPYKPYLHRCRFSIRKMRPKLGRILHLGEET